MGMRTSFLAGVTLVAVATSCTENTAPQVNYGLVRVSVKTTGGDLDNGYQIIAGVERRQLAANGTLTLTLQKGPATIELTDVASNCVVQGPSSVNVEVPRGDATDVAFVVTCSATGFRISIHTTGDDKPGWYTLNVTTRGSLAVGVDSTTVLSRLDPGAYTIKLVSPIPSCSITGSSELNVDLPPLTIVPVAFEVACAPVVRLEKIAYTVDHFNGSANMPVIALSRPDGSDGSELWAGKSPSWSPDGKKFAYSANDCEYAYYYYYYCDDVVLTMDPETLKKNLVAYGSTPAWSPRDGVIAYVHNGLLVLGGQAGGPSVVITWAGLKAADPAWSPDAQKIAFSCNTAGGFSRLCVAVRDTSLAGATPLSGWQRATVSQLSDSTSDPAVHPAWSHDGVTIAFTSVGTDGNKIATMPAAGGAVTKLTEGFDPAWSRDGTRLIFARSDGLFTMNRDGTDIQRLTTGRHRAPAWRP